MGALYLKQLDDSMEKTGLFYARFMDDWVVIAPTRWKLRSAIRIVNEILNVLRVEKHPDILKPVWFLAFQKTKPWLQLYSGKMVFGKIQKPFWDEYKTFIGKVERGFDFLGYFLKPGILSVSVVTIKNCVERISRLYPQRG
jgi:preprotein translocase subunit Sss1